jgi:hypothetical protein
LIRISISVGEALDRLSILEIKVNRLQKQTEVEAASKDLELLRAELAADGEVLNELPSDPLYQEIKRLNEVMWDAMQAIYDSKVVGGEAVTLTLEIIEVNKHRALTKRAIDNRAKSPIFEAKSFF